MRPAPAATVRVLIVDDHPTLLWGLERLIESEAPRLGVVATATSPEQALQASRTHRPDVVLLDLHLGLHSGLDVLPHLVSEGAQVLVLTGEQRPELLEQAVRHGARGVLRKDASADALLAAVLRIGQGEYCLDPQTLGRVLEGLLAPQPVARPCPDRARQDMLTPREREIIGEVVQGRGASNKVLAARLFISEHTLRNHLSAIYHKLGVGNRLELYAYALEHRLGDAADAESLAA